MKIRIFLFFILLFLVFAIPASASDAEYDYTVCFTKGEYVLYEGGEEYLRTVSVLPIFELT